MQLNNGELLIGVPPPDRSAPSATGAGLAVLWSAGGCAAEQKRQVLAAARRRPAGVVFQARAVSHQGEVAAFAAGLALLALVFGLGAFLGRHPACAPP